MTTSMHPMGTAAPTRPGRTLDVVMADDDGTDQSLMVAAAEEAGHPIQFRFVDDGSNLMTLLSSLTRVEELPDVIVLDLHMPRLDGHRTLDRLQAHPVFWQIPVITFSTSTRHRDLSPSLGLGARVFETRPDDFSAMVSFLRRLAASAARRLDFEDKSGLLRSIGS